MQAFLLGHLMAASQPANFNVQEFTDPGLSLVGGRLYTYVQGTTTQKTAYTDPAGLVPQTYTNDGAGGQYIALDARGELPTPLYLVSGAYDLALKRADGSTIWTRRAEGIDGAASAFASLLALSTGATLVGVATGRTLADKLIESKSILDFGGVANGLADNTTALTALRAEGYTTIRFPHLPTGSNTYYFGGALTASLTAGCMLDVEPGVIIKVPDIAYIDVTAKVLRDTHIYLTALLDDYWMTPASSNEPASRPVWLAQSERDLGRVAPILCNTSALTYRQVTSGADAFTVFVPTFASVSGVVIPIAVTTDYRVGLKKVIPGEQIFAQFTAAASATPVGMVRTPTSYYGLAASLVDAAIPQAFAKAIGGGTTVVNISYMGIGTHASYSAYKSVWSIRINSLRNFSWMFNGVEVANIDTDDEIIEAGFGGQGGVGGTITVQDWVSAKGKPQLAPKPINITIFGDSTSAETFPGSWPTQLVNMLDLAYGIRTNFIKNYAHSGDNSAAQLALCTAPNIASYDVVCILIGVNDIQGGVVESTYATNLGTMIDTCLAAGKKVIVGLPTMFYGQAQAGVGKGQATLNYDLGKGVRMKCLRTCAEKGVTVVDTWGAMGPILADWVNPALNTLANLGHDPVMFDSIHPTQTGKMLLAKAFAAAIAGALMKNGTLQTELADLSSANLSSGWTFSGTVPQWIREASGVVKLSGFMIPGTTVAGTVVYTMPENIRPIQTGRFTCRADTGECALDIDSVTGQVTVRLWPVGGGFVSLDNISYPSR